MKAAALLRLSLVLELTVWFGSTATLRTRPPPGTIDLGGTASEPSVAGRRTRDESGTRRRRALYGPCTTPELMKGGTR
jgi:hypothetical protein